MPKLDLYVFIQIIKSCILVFFIFISIAWLLQLSRLFSIMNNLQIDFNNIIFLSLFLIPNLMNVTLPFIIIFGLTIAFIKFDKDKEIIAIFSLGLSIKHILRPLLIIAILLSIFYLFLNLFLSPFIYEIYKKKEFKLRNLLNLNNVNIANFIELDNNLILDFTNQENGFEDVFIRYLGENENIVFAKEAKIKEKNQKLIFNLINGFKLSFVDNEIEKLEFDNYNLDFPLKNKSIYNNIDKNTQTIIELIKQREFKHIIEKFFDTIVLLTVIILFYFNNIKKNNYLLNKIFIYLFISIAFLIIQNLIKNINMNYQIYIFTNFLNIFLIYLYIIFDRYKIK